MCCFCTLFSPNDSSANQSESVISTWEGLLLDRKKTGIAICTFKTFFGIQYFYNLDRPEISRFSLYFGVGIITSQIESWQNNFEIEDLVSLLCSAMMSIDACGNVFYLFLLNFFITAPICKGSRSCCGYYIQINREELNFLTSNQKWYWLLII